MYSIVEGRDFALKGGKPGFYTDKGEWFPIDTKQFDKKELDKLTADYQRRRGSEQIQRDIEADKRAKQKPSTTATTATTAPAATATTAPAATTTPPTAKQTPSQPSQSTAQAPSRSVATTPPTAKPSPASDYMKAAAAARKSGDPAEMAKVRDMGMDIWRKSNPKLAAAADEKARIRGTAQTDNPLMKDMRSKLPVTPTVQAPAVKDLGLGQQSLSQNKFAGQSPTPKPASTPAPAPAISQNSKLEASKDSKMNKTAETLSKNALKKEAYDIVLDYILSEGHADTLSEAHYVMMQMDAEHIQNIIIQESV